MKSTFDSFIEILFLFAEMLKKMGKFFLVDSWGNTPLGTAVAVVSWLLVLSVACGILWGIFSWLNTTRTKLREWDCTVIKKNGYGGVHHDRLAARVRSVAPGDTRLHLHPGEKRGS